MEGTTSISSLPNDNKSKQVVLEKKEVQRTAPTSSQPTNQVISNTSPVSQNYSIARYSNHNLSNRYNHNYNIIPV